MTDATKEGRAAQEQWTGKTPDEISALMQDPRFLRLSALSDHAKLAQRVSRVGAVRVVFDVYLPVLLGFVTVLTILATTKASLLARSMEGFLAIGFPLAAVLVSWKRRNDIRRWLKVKAHRLRDRRHKKAMKVLLSLPENSPRRASLQGKLQKHFERQIDDLKNGIY
jgi:hypothetical protein